MLVTEITWKIWESSCKLVFSESFAAAVNTEHLESQEGAARVCVWDSLTSVYSRANDLRRDQAFLLGQVLY